MNLFLRLLDLGSITAAAHSLILSVAVASQCLRRLEDGLGARLLQRTNRSLHPTPEGLALAEQGRPLIEEIDALASGLRRAGSASDGYALLFASPAFQWRV